jgi:hypothetical protein
MFQDTLLPYVRKDRERYMKDYEEFKTVLDAQDEETRG